MHLILQDVRRAMASPAAKNRQPQRQFSVHLPAELNLPEAKQAPEGVEPRRAGVLALIFPKNDELHLLLTRRTDDLPEHAGQIALPGGARERQDDSLVETALRETEEELHIDPECVEIVGELAPVYVPPSNFLVTPFVGLTSERPDYRPDRVEVEEVVEVPLSTLLDPSAVEQEAWELRGFEIEVPFYRYGEYKIWGATARMLSVLVAALSTEVGQ